MEMKQVMTVLGVRRFNDTVEGQKYDFTKLVCALDFPSSANNAIGQDSQALPYGTSANFAHFEKFKREDFPMQVELTVNMTTKGFEVVGHRFIEAVKPQVKAAA